MKVIRILLPKIVNQPMENIDKILENNTWNFTRSPGAGHSLLLTCIKPLIKNHIHRYMVYKPYILLVLLKHCQTLSDKPSQYYNIKLYVIEYC